MTKKYLFPWVCTVFIILQSCNFFSKELDIEIPNATRLAIFSFISPQDTLIKVQVKWAEPSTGQIPIGQSNNDDVLGAEVTISDGTNNILLDYNSFRGYYFRSEDFPITAGTTYHLKIKTPQGLEANATCTIPLNNIDKSENEYQLITSSTGERGLLIKWKDIVGESNFYALSRLVVDESQNGQILIVNQQNYRGFTDSEGDGIILSSPILNYQRSIINANGSIRYHYVLMSNVDYHYHEYHRTLDLLIQQRDNPFAEPFNLYSNIEGAVGVFASFNYVVVQL